MAYIKPYVFNMVQPINLIFCEVIEIIEQKFSKVQIFYLDPSFLLLVRSIFLADDIIHIKYGNSI